MGEIIQMPRQQPGPEAVDLENDPLALPPPDAGLTIAVGPYRDDAGGQVPAEEDGVGVLIDRTSIDRSLIAPVYQSPSTKRRIRARASWMRSRLVA